MSPHSSRRSSLSLFPSVLLVAMAIALPGCFVPAWSPPGGYYGGRGSYGNYRPYYGGDDYGRYAPPRRVYVPVYQDDDDDDHHHHHGNRHNDEWQGSDSHRNADAQREQQRAEQRARNQDAAQQQRAQQYESAQQQRAQRDEAKQQQHELARKLKEQRDEELRQQAAAQPHAPRPRWSQPDVQPAVRGRGEPRSWIQQGRD